MTSLMSQAHIAIPLHLYRLQPGDGTVYQFGVGWFTKTLSHQGLHYNPDTRQSVASKHTNSFRGNIQDVISGVNTIDYVMVQILGPYSQSSYDLRKDSLGKTDEEIETTALYYKEHTRYPYLWSVIAVILGVAVLAYEPRNLTGAIENMKRASGIASRSQDLR